MLLSIFALDCEICGGGFFARMITDVNFLCCTVSSVDMGNKRLPVRLVCGGGLSSQTKRTVAARSDVIPPM